MATSTQPKVQKLECREDLELLVVGDVLIVDGNRDIRPGLALYRHQDNSHATFLTRGIDESIGEVIVKKDNLDVSMGLLIIKKPYKQYIIRSDNNLYPSFDRKLTEAGIIKWQQK